MWGAVSVMYRSCLGDQGTMGCTPNSVPMVFIVFSRDSWG